MQLGPQPAIGQSSVGLVPCAPPTPLVSFGVILSSFCQQVGEANVYVRDTWVRNKVESVPAGHSPKAETLGSTPGLPKSQSSWPRSPRRKRRLEDQGSKQPLCISSHAACPNSHPQKYHGGDPKRMKRDLFSRDPTSCYQHDCVTAADDSRPRTDDDLHPVESTRGLGQDQPTAYPPPSQSQYRRGIKE